MGRVRQALVVLALVQQAQGEAARAQATLKQALALAQQKRAGVLDEGAPMLALLSRVRGELRLYAERLLAGAPAIAAAGDTGPLAQAAASLPEPLSERELAVLRLLAAGLSNQDIAEALVVAQSTVHWHVKNIYSKLGVHSRTQAALAARS